MAAKRSNTPAKKPRPAASPVDYVGAEHIPVLLLLFFFSGCAALIYEIVWFQLLELSVGSSAVSMAVLLATYMGGMFIGSLGLARVVPVERHPLRVYTFIEFGIAACGLAVLWLLPYAGGLYVAIGGPGWSGLLLRGLVSAICLLPPTILMGATLPAVSRWVEGTPRGVSWLGFLYGGNTLGAVAGCLLAGFYLLRVFDMFTATYVAVAINLLVGAGALWMSRTTGYERTAPEKSAKKRLPAPPIWPVLVTIALSGATAMSAEVVWTRLLSLKLGATVYTYSLILAAILLGLGLGSYAGSWLTRLKLGPRALLGLCQALLIAGIAWAAYLLTGVLPYQQPSEGLAASVMATFQHDMLTSLWVVLPAALLWGASFPLALAAASRPDEEDHGKTVGYVYAANTAGAIVGSLGTPLVLMAWLGSQRIQQLLIVVAAVSALLMLLPVGLDKKRRARLSRGDLAFAAIPVVLLVALVATIQPVPGQLIGYGPGSYAWNPAYGTFIYVGEGMNSSVAVSRFTDGVLNYHNAGKVQASSNPEDLRLQRMLGHLTTLQQDDPASVLVIGCGSGATAGAVSVDPRVKSLTIAEIEPLVPKAAQEYFSAYNEAVVANPKTTTIIDDGRHYLMTSGRKFDAITCDPFDPWTKGAASLSTVEFYESAREHLNPGGTITVWVPLYQTRPDTVRSEVATFKSVFPNAIIWDNVTNGAGDVVMSGRVGDTPIDLDDTDARVAEPGYERVRESLDSIGFASVDDLFATFGGQGDDLDPWLAGAELNRDRNLRLQYLAGSGFIFGTDESAQIYSGLTGNRTWPDSLFTGSPDRVAAVKTAAGF